MTDPPAPNVDLLRETNPVDRVTDRLDNGRLWIQGGWGDVESGRVCILGALRSCDLLSSDVETLIGQVIEEQYPDRMDEMCLAQFNDHPDTTWLDVECVLEKASVLWDEAHS